MSKKTYQVFHALMKNGWIDRRENPLMWEYANDIEEQIEQEDLKAVMGVDFYNVGDRIYLIPTQDNDLFLKNNIDYRRDIKADSTVRIRDLYLLNYLSIYLLYLFFSGEGSDPLCREFITKEEFIKIFTEHCNAVEKGSEIAQNSELDYSDNFIQLASAWLSKIDGELDSIKFDTHYGIVNRILNKYKEDQLFEIDLDNIIKPTRKTKDLMPYFLRKQRVNSILNWIKEADENATN